MRRAAGARRRGIAPMVRSFAGTPWLALALPDSFVDFLAVYRHLARCGHSDPHLLALYLEYLHSDIIPDDQGFARSSRKYEHHPLPCRLGQASPS